VLLARRHIDVRPENFANIPDWPLGRVPVMLDGVDGMVIMALFDGIQLPPGDTGRAVRLYLEAQDRKDYSGAAEFFHDDVLFNGLVLKANGRDEVTGGLASFARDALDWIRVEAVAQPETGDVSRVLALYWVKLKPATEPQVVCDHLTIRDGRIARIDNVFDLGKVPAM